jgi:hypothetical protein
MMKTAAFTLTVADATPLMPNLNRVLNKLHVLTTAVMIAIFSPARASAPTSLDREEIQAECSRRADQQGLHDQARQDFRASCKQAAGVFGPAPGPHLVMTCADSEFWYNSSTHKGFDAEVFFTGQVELKSKVGDGIKG